MKSCSHHVRRPCTSDSADAGVDIEKAPEITIDDFFKTQLRIGQIIKCENVEKSKKLL